MRVHNDPQFDDAPEAFGFPYREEDAIPVEVTRGGIVFFHGHLLHRSLKNAASSGYRRSYVSHYMSAESVLTWSGGIPENQREDCRDIVMVAGNDPYSDRPLEYLSVPYYLVRQ